MLVYLSSGLFAMKMWIFTQINLLTLINSNFLLFSFFFVLFSLNTLRLVHRLYYILSISLQLTDCLVNQIDAKLFHTQDEQAIRSSVS